MLMLHCICCCPGEGGGGKFLYNSAEVLSFQRKMMHLTITEHKNQQYHECVKACQYSVRQISLEINSVNVPDMVDQNVSPQL